MNLTFYVVAECVSRVVVDEFPWLQKTEKMRCRRIWAAVALAISAPAAAQERIHADLPLFSGTNQELWPQHFADEDNIGCSSRVALGDWKQTSYRKEGKTPAVRWLSFAMVGVFHCAIVESSAGERADLDRAGSKLGWFVELGDTVGLAGPVELWALQSGVRPGSDYLLLSRKSGTGPIKSFYVLQLKCASNQIRKGKVVDNWITDYCSINSARALRSLARRMAKLPPAGMIEFAGTAAEGAKSDR